MSAARSRRDSRIRSELRPLVRRFIIRCPSVRPVIDPARYVSRSSLLCSAGACARYSRRLRPDSRREYRLRIEVAQTSSTIENRRGAAGGAPDGRSFRSVLPPFRSTLPRLEWRQARHHAGHLQAADGTLFNRLERPGP